MATIEIRTDGRTRTVEDVDALVSEVRSGKIGRAARVRPAGTDEWIRADEVPEVKALFSAAVWSAWEEDVDESVLDAFQAPETPRVSKLEPAPTIPPAGGHAPLLDLGSIFDPIEPWLKLAPYCVLAS